MVHIAYGWDDYLLGVEKGDVFCPVDGAGHYTKEGGEYAGPLSGMPMSRSERPWENLLARQKISTGVAIAGDADPYHLPGNRAVVHLRSKDKEKMLSEIKGTTWFPDWAGNARFYDFVSDARDWCISRQRYWGIPIPVWQCSSCPSYRVFGTVAELNEATGTGLTDPHRPYVDEITVPCSCGGTMKRVDDIFDVWFDSAMASWATLGFQVMIQSFMRCGLPTLLPKDRIRQEDGFIPELRIHNCI